MLPPTNVTYQVTCPDGVVRHDGPFHSAVDAARWADTGHACLAADRHTVVATIPNAAPAPRYRHNADGSVVCPHRDLSVCAVCAAADPTLVDVYGAHFEVPDPAERDALLADLARVI